ncbi:hypothetical protein [Bradyrhizobium sp. NP1]|jgi:hypothetical protein|uniref:hypothetical protein n=1 Tax=Bradyrhizobium sp. NP1 TaxID=3049772 RepID=UPI0025A66106|nr:hypothetical protein [Bradyrhizobium sp. NP1]WJR79518.1 hypothetical protein QOU61_06995 [Bradyrhizobium sp. NP1]
MRARRIAFCLVVATSAVGATGSAASAEEYRGTWEQQMACTPDVWRFCASQIPNVDGIVACLRQNTPQLSSSCRAVFESNASAQAQQQPQPQPPGQPRGRVASPQPMAPPAPPPQSRTY